MDTLCCLYLIIVRFCPLGSGDAEREREMKRRVSARLRKSSSSDCETKWTLQLNIVFMGVHVICLSPFLPLLISFFVYFGNCGHLQTVTNLLGHSNILLR